MDRQQELRDILSGRNDVVATLNTVESLQRAYPFFTLPSAITLKEYLPALSEEVKQRLIRRIALSSPDPTTLYQLLTPDGENLHHFYPKVEKEPKPDTEDAITTFLNTYGNSEPGEEELLEKLIFNPVPDYASVLEAQDTGEHTSEAGSQDALIDAFIEKQRRIEESPVPQPVVTVPPEEPLESSPKNPDPDSMLSESLAKIFIKQHRYDKAYEIISQLSLNFPEKSIYFADQLRFLKKLIINQQYKNSKNK